MKERRRPLEIRPAAGVTVLKLGERRARIERGADGYMLSATVAGRVVDLVGEDVVSGPHAAAMARYLAARWLLRDPRADNLGYEYIEAFYTECLAKLLDRAGIAALDAESALLERATRLGRQGFAELLVKAAGAEAAHVAFEAGRFWSTARDWEQWLSLQRRGDRCAWVA